MLAVIRSLNATLKAFGDYGPQMCVTENRPTAHLCPNCEARVIAPVLLVETMQTIQPIEKPRGFVCSAHCGWETHDLHYFGSSGSA